MISKETLKKIVMLGYLTDDMLDELIPITDSFETEENEYIFHQGDRADHLYMVLRGKVLLEQPVGPKVTLTMSAIKPGYTFGWSAMLDEENYTTDAICDEPSELLSMGSNDLKALFEKNHSVGYIMSKRLLRVIKNRYDIRTEQLIKAIADHPDIGSLL